MEKEKPLPDISGVPVQPGVYLMKDEAGNILYIGKAVNLRNRVRSYFQPSAKHTDRIAVMVSLARKVDFTVTGNEIEALILENNLIKKESPRFNVMLRDDKTYPYLKLTVNEKFPRLFIVRKVLKDGAQYFGPYVSGKSVRAAKALIHRIFPLRLSKDSLDDASIRRPCLNYHMKRCLAPCAGNVSAEAYREMVERIAKFLRGKDTEVLDDLEKRMRTAAKNDEFELAAIIRDQIFAIKNLHEKQSMDTARHIDEDYIAVLCEGGIGIVRILMVRGGKLTGDQNFTFKKADDPAELTGAFIEQFYNSAFAVPGEIVVNVDPADREVIERWLSDLKGKKVEIILPERGRKKQLIEMAMENARFTLAGFAQGEESLKEALGEIKSTLGMEHWPAVMEAVDISNMSGLSSVGSLVTFFNGAPSKKDYKRFRITVTGPDDYASIAEVVRRRFKRLKDEQKPFPDLLLIDGGAGQVSAAAEAVRPFAPHQVIIGIAKGDDRNNPETDRIIMAGRKEPLPFPASSPGKFMLQRLRDEAHRFAIQYHRQTREKAAFRHGIEDLAGIGPKRKKLLIQTFGSLKAAKEATVEELRAALSISEKLAQKLHEKL
ncbi:MAG: excinuclease ABC subunit UvrC [Nitrospinae bacterium]|nr:excinuclease ABC subunit UvrC [Nitrospinota bacterium]